LRTSAKPGSRYTCFNGAIGLAEVRAIWLRRTRPFEDSVLWLLSLFQGQRK
jgi:hypothetical protein